MSKFDDQISRMKQMMTYGKVNEDKTTHSNVEYHVEGADGNVYGIIREGSKFYIKIASPRDRELVAEDYDYIGGFRNRKTNEYIGYNVALKQLELKMMSLNEAYCKKGAIVESLNPDRKEDLVIEATNKMQEEIARQRQIMFNSASILNEDAPISMKNTGTPEAPKTAKFNPKIGEPFEETATEYKDMDKDIELTELNPKDQGAPFEDDVKVTDSDMQSTKNPKGGKAEYEAAKYVPKGSVANQKPKGGKVVKVNEEQVLAWSDNENYMDTSTETHIGDSAPFDKTVKGGESVSDDDSETKEKVEEGCNGDVAMFMQGDNQNSPKSGVGEIGCGEPFDEKTDDGGIEESIDTSDVAGFDDEEETMNEAINNPNNMIIQFKEKLKNILQTGTKDDAINEYERILARLGDVSRNLEATGRKDSEEFSRIDKMKEMLWNHLDRLYDIPDEEFNSNDGMEDNGEPTVNSDDDAWYHQNESTKKGKPFNKKADKNPDDKKNIKDVKDGDDVTLLKDKLDEDKLDVFGKTPGYRKKPMTIPTHKHKEKEGYKDWNDDSVEGDEPFGTKIGSSAPFDKEVKVITDAIMESLQEMKINKKKKN